VKRTWGLPSTGSISPVVNVIAWSIPFATAPAVVLFTRATEVPYFGQRRVEPAPRLVSCSLSTPFAETRVTVARLPPELRLRFARLVGGKVTPGFA